MNAKGVTHVVEQKEAILVADDEPAVLDVCLRALRLAGYRAVGVSTGTEALQRLQEEPFDLLLTDIRMPDLDGLEVLRQVKQVNPDLPVVLFTGYGTLDIAADAVRLGAQGFLLKPFHAGDLRRAVEEALSKMRLWRENVRLKALMPLLQTSQALMEELDTGHLYETIAQAAANLAFVDAAWLLMRDRAGGVVEMARAGMADSALPKAFLREFPFSTSDSGRVSLSACDDPEHPCQQLAAAFRLADVLVLPLVVQRETTGYLCLGRAQGRGPFAEADGETLSILARQVAAAIENARLLQRTRDYAEGLEAMVAERTRELKESEAQVRLLYEASRQLQASLDLDQVVSDVLALAMSIAEAHGASLASFDENGQLCTQVERGRWDPPALRWELQARIAQTLREEKEAVFVADLHADVAVSADAVGSALGLPLVQGEQVIAFLLLWHPKPRHFSLEHAALLLPICSQAAAVLNNARIFRETSRALDRAHAEIAERARELEMTTQQLVRAEKLALIGQLAAGIAHELGNVIAPLRVYARLLSDIQPGDKDYSIYCARVTEITQRAGEILGQFSDFARKDSGRRCPVDLREIVTRSLFLMEYALRRKSIAVHRQDAPALPRVQADPGQLEQVFINMILNAVDAMEAGGELYINTRAVLAPGGPPHYVEISFRDTGCGIAPEHLGRLFEPFFTTKELGKGTGLGLFISYGIIERHGGTIDVQSQLGEGTTFRIRLPVPQELSGGGDSVH